MTRKIRTKLNNAMQPGYQKIKRKQQKPQPKPRKTADALAANLAKELKVKQFIMDSIPELEANWKKEQLTVAEDRARMARVNNKLRLNLRAL